MDIKKLKDKDGNVFAPVTSANAIMYSDSETFEDKLDEFALNITQLEGTSATALTDGKIEGAKRYTITLTEATDTMAVTEIEESAFETIIYLNVGADVTTPVTLPDTYKSVGTPSFEAGKNYVISVLNGILVSGEIITTTSE